MNEDNDPKNFSTDEIATLRAMMVYWKKVEPDVPYDRSPLQPRISRFYSAMQALEGLTRMPKSAPAMAGVRSLFAVCRNALDEIEADLERTWQ